MSANVESMFYAGREVPWHGLGVSVENAPTSKDAIVAAGLNWEVMQEDVYTSNGILIPNYKANIRSTDRKPLGIVGNRYKIVQNEDAFSFTDSLIGEGVTYETAGSLREGKCIWLLAKMPESYNILGDEVEPYIVFTNTHDGSGSIRVAMTPVRVVCNNTLNLALNSAKRVWQARHTGNIETKLEEAKETLELAHIYMGAVQEEFEELNKIKLNDDKIIKITDYLIPIEDEDSNRKKENQNKIKTDLLYRFNSAPDLKVMDKTAARFIQAVADTASHIEPSRKTVNYQENHFIKMIDGNDFLNRAIKICKDVAA